MPNVIIPVRHQSAPTPRYDSVLAREAAAAKDPVQTSRQDWDAIDWNAANPSVRRRRGMTNQDFDKEFDAPGHHDPAIALLEQRAYLEQIELRPEQWVEESLELYEANCAAAKAQHLDQQDRWQGKENQAARLVNILHPNAVMRKLRAAGVDARCYEHPNARIWLNDWTAHGLVGVNAWVTPEPMDEDGYLLSLAHATSQKQKDILTENFLACHYGHRIQRTLTSLQDPYGPEWSVMRFNEHGVATKERFRGWRTAMLVLITAGVLTEEEVDQAFGAPIGEAGAWYRQQLQVLRRIRLGGK
jgi:hypothetical protein